MAGEKEEITSKSDKYEVIRKLGEGYTGEVYLVNDRNRKEPVALKLLNPAAFKEGQLEAFKREFMLLSDLHHPHVCKVYDFGYAKDRERYFFTMELVTGTDLYSYVEKLSISEIEEIFVEIADALGFIHSAQLIHFDIKGDNILITQVGDTPIAKIVDFGLAAPSFDAPENIAGTVRYISPEMITKKQVIDYRADLYSLGIVLYRMLAGRYPEQGSTMKDVLKWHTQHTTIEKAPLESRGVPKYLIDVIEKLTNRIPTERFSSAAVVIRYIELHSGKTYSKTQKRLVATLMEEGPLVARDAVMYKIRSALSHLGKKESLGEDEHQTLVLHGPVGSGKSRIIKEAKYISQLTEVETCIVHGETDGQDMEQFAKALECSSSNTELMQAELFKRQPLCIMVDNLGKAAKPVREFISAFAGQLYSSRFLGKPLQIFLIVTMETSGPAATLPVPLHLDVEQQYLKPFTAEDVTQYIRLSLGESDPSVDQVGGILKFSGGMPGMVKTAIASLDAPDANLSKNSDKIFTERMKALDQTAKKTLGFIAFAERPLTGQELISFTGLLIESALAELLKEGFIVYERELDAYRTGTGAMACVAQTIYSSEEKKEIAGKLLEHFKDEAAPDIDALVRYASISLSDKEKAGHLIKAAEAKERLAELDDAYKYYSQAIGLLDEKDARYPELLRKQARRQLLRGRFDEAVKMIDEATGLTNVSISDLTSQSWIYRLQHQPEKALEIIEKAIEISDKSDSSPDHIRLRNEKAQCFVQIGKFEEAVQIFSEMEIKAGKLPLEVRQKIANNNLGLALSQLGRYEEAIAFYKEKFETFTGEKQLAASILSQLGYVYQQAGRLNEAMDAFRKSWEIYSSIGDTHSAMAILGNLVSICQSKALFTDALCYVKESIKTASFSGSEKDLAWNFLTLGTLYITLGLDDVARRYLNEAASIFQKVGDERMEAWVQISFAYLYKNIGRYKEAIACLDNVLKKGHAQDYDDLLLWGNHGAADMLIDMGEVEKATRYINDIDPKWTGVAQMNEVNIKVELLNSKYNIAKSALPDQKEIEKLTGLAVSAEKLELRELVGEIYHVMGEFYHRAGNDENSALYVGKSKEIIEDIAGTLSEEYRDSFLKQQFRHKVFEDSIRLASFVTSSVDLSSDKEEGKQKPKVRSAVHTEARSASTINIPSEAAGAQPTSVFTGAFAGDGSIEIIGQSDAMMKIKSLLESIKDNHIAVFISGEDGTEKELIARAIREQGVFKDKPWKKLDISGFSEEYIEKALWGADEECLLGSSGEGTLYLANVESLTRGLQKKLLKVLRKKEFVRISDGAIAPFKARLITSSCLHPDKLARFWKFKVALAKLFKEVVIILPPLKARKGDIPLLAEDILQRITSEHNGISFTLSPAALKILMEYGWPTNLRELEQVLRSACVLAKDGVITHEHISVYIKV